MKRKRTGGVVSDVTTDEGKIVVADEESEIFEKIAISAPKGLESSCSDPP